MTQREKLIEILSEKIYPKEGVDPVEVVADFLIDRGVVVLPCKVGDTVYYISGISGKLIKSAIRSTLQESEVYFTSEAAKAALKKRRNEK